MKSAIFSSNHHSSTFCFQVFFSLMYSFLTFNHNFHLQINCMCKMYNVPDPRLSKAFGILFTDFNIVWMEPKSNEYWVIPQWKDHVNPGLLDFCHQIKQNNCSSRTLLLLSLKQQPMSCSFPGQCRTGNRVGPRASYYTWRVAEFMQLGRWSVACRI